MKRIDVLCLSFCLAITMAAAGAYAAPVASSESPGQNVAQPPENAAIDGADALIEDMQIPYGDSGSYLSSQFAKSSGQIEDALHYLRKVHKKNPANADIATELMGVLLLSGHIDEAVTVARKIHEKDSKDPIPALMMVIDRIRQDKLGEAAQILDSDFSEGKGQLWLPLVAGWLDAGQDRLKKPIVEETMVANVGRAGAIVNYHLALIHNRAGFKHEAIKNFAAAIEDPANAPTRMMEMLMAFYEQNGKPSALAPIVDAYVAQHPGEIDWKLVLVSNPKDGVAEVLFTMGSIMQTAGLVQDSVIYFQLAQFLKPDFALVQMALAESYTQMKLYKQATQIYAKVPVDTRFYSRAQLSIAVGYERMGRLNEALAMLDKLSHDLPESYEAQIIRGDLLRIHKRYDAAIESYTRAIDAAKAKDNQLWAAYFARGTCHERMGRWEDAEIDLRTALELKPDQADVLNYLGYSLLLHGGDLAEARILVERALALKPDDAAIIDSMGWILYLAGDYDAAVAHLERAIDILPNDPSIYDHLGDAYWQLGRKTEARYQWERSLAYSPDDASADATRKKLKNGLPQLAQSKAKVSARVEIEPAPIAQE